MGVAIEQLKAEHRAIKGMLEVLDEVCRRLQAGERAEPEHLNQLVGFFREFADGCHHGKEEEIFFPALEQAGIPKEGGPIGVMLYEHDKMREAMNGLAGAVQRYQTGDIKAAADLIRHASDYAAMLRSHIEKEHHALFKMAEAYLSPEEERGLAEQFETLEAEKMGKGADGARRALLERMQTIYGAGEPGQEGGKGKRM
jgi:hemerythrin-like domain-containing protein